MPLNNLQIRTQKGMSLNNFTIDLKKVYHSITSPLTKKTEENKNQSFFLKLN